MMAVGAVITHIMPYLNLLQVPRSTAGLIAGAISVVSILGRFGFGWLADLFDKRYVAAVTCGLMSVGMFLLCYVDTGWIMLLFLLLFPIGFGGAIDGARGDHPGVLREGLFRPSHRAGHGLLALVGSIIGPTLAGYLFDTTGSYFYTWIMLGIASSFTVVLMLNIGPRKQA